VLIQGRTDFLISHSGTLPRLLWIGHLEPFNLTISRMP